MELLAPAGSFSALKAAVSAGADAVYFGGTALNARVFGKNFTDDELRQAADYLRVHNVKSYLTLNTLVSDKEIKDLFPFIKHINEIGIDAVIVQDIGLLKHLREVAPDLPVHASTQMTIHNLDGVRKAAEMGFTRVVLSRELPESEIRYICENSPVEIEAFIHGALCMCYSGQCYMSSVIGERSGNRGKCAQPCRKPYENGYELSLKDLCMAKDFKRFQSTGVHSLKIEGRMKSPEYVAGVVSVYRKLIDENRNATDEEYKALSRLFSRDGFTNDYFNDKPSKKMFGVRTEENKADTREAEVSYSDKKTAVNMTFTAKKDLPMKLLIECSGKVISAEEQPPFIAQKVATTIDDCKKQLSKLGETEFCLKEFDCELDDGLFIPVGVLNRLRRECCEKLETELCKIPERRIFRAEKTDYKTVSSDKIIAHCQTKERAEAVKDYVDEIRLPYYIADNSFNGKLCAVLPEIMFDREIPLAEKKLKELREMGVNAVACGNLGQLELLKKLGFAEIHGETGLNIFNSESILMAKELGFSSVALSFEANSAQVRDMKKSILCNEFVYGRYPVMTIQNCLMKNRGKCIDFKGYSYLKDTTGRSFPVFCRPPHRNAIYNAVPLYLGDKKELIPKDCGKLFCFTTESGTDAVRILEMYKNNEEYNGEFTRGFSGKKV
ncbi:MAG: U32 family peptidase [Clostridia bacterium]|nr:U32 family peptidase [Clostridia bacterium]